MVHIIITNVKIGKSYFANLRVFQIFDFTEKQNFKLME